MQWTPAPWISALELRRITTTHRTAALHAVHLDLAFGVSFQLWDPWTLFTPHEEVEERWDASESPGGR